MTESLLDALASRGLLADATPGARDRLAAGPVTAYAGFDPTADSLHVGNLVPVMGLAWLQRLGGRPIALVGGGTGMVGDPSGKRSERPFLPEDEIDRNAAAIRGQLERFLSFEGQSGALLVNNAAWLRTVGLLQFLRDTGKHFTVNYMLQKESVRSRMETGISFTEFSYMLVQAYDYWHLFREHGCELQMGGSDQWGNITAGIELVARAEQRQVHGVAFPLLTTAGGAKFGKSESGNIWLDPARTSPYQFYQFWLNADDRDAERFLKLFTFLPLEAVATAMDQQASDASHRPAQRLLAREVTSLVHGEAEARRAESVSAKVFGGEPSEDYATLAESMPNVTVTRAELEVGLSLTEAFVRAGLASSKSEARRGIQGKGYSVNESLEIDVDRRLSSSDLREGKFVMLRKGKKNYVMLVVE